MFLNNLGLHTCCIEIILHCVSVSNQLQQWTNVCSNFSPKKWGVGDASPCQKSEGTPSPLVPAPLHPCWGSAVSYYNGVWGRTPAEIEFGAFYL